MKRLILIGGGHAHLYILKQLERKRWPDIEVLLISPKPYQYYSGMFSGFVEGVYTLEDIRIDLIRLCEQANITFVQDSVVQIDPVRQEVTLLTGERIGYDVISFNVGSLTANTEIPGAQAHAVLIKPNYMIPAVIDTFLTNDRPVVVGGGASGVELSLSLQARRKAAGNKTPVTLISAGDLLEYAGKRASMKIQHIVQSKGIDLIRNDRVIAVTRDELHLHSGNTVGFDHLLWLTGPSAPTMFRNGGIPADDHGYMLVNENLASVAYPNMFGAGDCVSLQLHPSVHKAGVYAVREAPVLWFNLQSYISGGKLKSYRPQPRYLSILSTGGGEAFLLYGGQAFHGKWCSRLKRKIDMAFVRKYTVK